MIRTLVEPRDYMMKLDLQDIYFMIPIQEEHVKKFLRAEFQGKVYVFQCRSECRPHREPSQGCQNQ